ncbi:hypothetical protein K431DRAFT_199549, partial [Polychaeton citri CBS 116435]
DSPLDTANFLSFEDWKKQNLAKVGQNPEHIGQSHHAPGDRRRPDSPPNKFTKLPAGAESESTDKPAASPALRSKDAGKTCKERTNYASFDCAATVLKSNLECKSASSVLVENKDSYMLNQCSATNKFFIVELCNDILIDTVVLANYEFFSSIFRHFRVSVSDRYPVKMEKWKDLGTFEARNTREVQAFLIEHPQIWARYMRIEFLSHYGNEYYCPLSLVRVHGTTMMEQFRQEEELSRGETSDGEEIESEVITAITPAEPKPSAAIDENSSANASNSRLSDSSPPVASSETIISRPSSSSNSTRASAASSTMSSPQAPQPSTQESFFNSIHKRLKQLESNSTLSLQYIEEQSRILRDAFSKVEKRQMTTTSKFLSNLNSTVLAELQGFRQAYDQLWQSTVIELDGQKEQYQREMLVMSTRLSIVADELVWQKRMAIVQSTLVIICLGFVLFAR